MHEEELLSWIREQYAAEPEYPWHDANAVLRRGDNGRWFGVILDVPPEKLGLPRGASVRVLNVKCDPLMAASLRSAGGIFPAYHMNKQQWISILLDGSVPAELTMDLVAVSRRLTAPKQKIKAVKP